MGHRTGYGVLFLQIFLVSMPTYGIMVMLCYIQMKGKHI